MTGQKEDSHKKQKKTWKEDTDQERVEKKPQFSGALAADTIVSDTISNFFRQAYRQHCFAHMSATAIANKKVASLQRSC